MANGGLKSWNNRCSDFDIGEKMNVDFIFKIAAIGIIVTVLNLLLVRFGREEQAMLTTLAGLVVVLLMIVKSIAQLFSEIKGIFGL